MNAYQRHRLAIILVTAMLIGNSGFVLFAASIAITPTQGGYLNAYGSFVGGDFLVFYSAAKAAINDSATLAYDPRHLNGLQDAIAGHETPDMPFFYPPVALFLLIPLAFFPYITAFYLWLAATLGSLAVVLRNVSHRWLVAVMVLASPLVLRAGVTGQSGNLTAALIGAGLLLLNRYPIAAGAFLGGMTFKPHLALVLPVCLAAGGHWRTFVATGLTAGALTIASVGVFGVSSWSGFIENSQVHAGDFFADDGDQWHRIPTVVVSVQRLTGNATAAWTVQIVAGVVGAAVAGIIWIRSTDGLARSLALAAAMFLTTPKALYYDMVVFCIPLAFLASEVLRRQISVPSVLLAATIWALPSLGQISLSLEWQLGPLFLVASLAFAALRCRNTRDNCVVPTDQASPPL